MTSKQLEDLSELLLGSAKEVMFKKNQDYSKIKGGGDALSQFKETAKDLGVSPLAVWYVYAKKHWSAIQAYVKNNGVVESEPIEERMVDMINYILLLNGLLIDAKASLLDEEAVDEAFRKMLYE